LTQPQGGAAEIERVEQKDQKVGKYEGLVTDCAYRVDVLVDDRVVVERDLSAPRPSTPLAAASSTF
jgi:hypothetical protein